jgi:hypothetical protein
MDKRTRRFVEVLNDKQDTAGVDLEGMDPKTRQKFLAAVSEEYSQLAKSQPSSDLESMLKRIERTFVEFGIVDDKQLATGDVPPVATRGMLTQITQTEVRDERVVRDLGDQMLSNLTAYLEEAKKLYESPGK